jgi:hypothetical protein
LRARQARGAIRVNCLEQPHAYDPDDVEEDPNEEVDFWESRGAEAEGSAVCKEAGSPWGQRADCQRAAAPSAELNQRNFP